MKYLSAISTLLCMLVVSFMLQACHRQPHYHQRLVQADSLMWQHPDSALALLETFHTTELTTEADSAYFALLITQAKDKNFVLQTEDSLMLKSIRFYDKNNEPEKNGRAHFYLGCIYRDRLRPAQAMEQFLTAVPLLKHSKNLKLLGRAYNNMAYLYYIEEEYDKADSLYQETESVAESIHDTILQAEAITRQSYILMFQDKYNYINAEKAFTKARRLISNIESPSLKADIALGLSLLYGQMKETEKAILHAQEVQRLHKDYMADYALGEAFFFSHQLDSAEVFYGRALDSSPSKIKALIYLRLSDIARSKSQFEEASILEQNYNSLNATFQTGVNKAELAEAEKNMLIKLHQNPEATKNSSSPFLITFFIIILCFCVLYVLRTIYKNKKDTTKQHETIKAEIQHLQAKRSALQKEASARSEVMLKINRILQSHKQFGESEEQLTDEDWQEFILDIDKQWNDITLKLQTDFQLTKDEIRLCSLYLTDLPTSHFGEIMQTSRDATYKRAKRILEQRMGISDKKNLREVLRELALSIALLLFAIPSFAQNPSTYAYTNERNVEVLLHLDEDLAQEEQIIYLFSFCPWISGNEAAIWDSIQTKQGDRFVKLHGYTTAENSFEIMFSKVGPTSFRFYALPNDTIEFTFNYIDNFLSPEFKNATRGETHNSILPLRIKEEKLISKLRDKDPYITMKNFSNDTTLMRLYIHHLHETEHPSIAFNFYNSLKRTFKNKLSEDSIHSMRLFIAKKFPNHPQCSLDYDKKKEHSPQGDAAWRRRNEIIIERWGYENRTRNNSIKEAQRVLTR
ncbi:MAG: hypothetical protein Q4D30_07550 [Bacteroidales bacterium]|nr:hypothetical protein [Bacteroidales bacterium]